MVTKIVLSGVNIEGDFSMSFSMPALVKLVMSISIVLGAALDVAQTGGPAPATIPQSAGQIPSSSQLLPPCPTHGEQSDALGKKTPSGSEPAASQPAERSGIRPSADGHETSAAPTVKGPDHAVRSPVDCPLIPGHPNALPPGNYKLPELSK
jgi:hypothetical protein